MQYTMCRGQKETSGKMRRAYAVSLDEHVGRDGELRRRRSSTRLFLYVAQKSKRKTTTVNRLCKSTANIIVERDEPTSRSDVRRNTGKINKEARKKNKKNKAWPRILQSPEPGLPVRSLLVFRLPSIAIYFILLGLPPTHPYHCNIYLKISPSILTTLLYCSPAGLPIRRSISLKSTLATLTNLYSFHTYTNNEEHFLLGHGRCCSASSGGCPILGRCACLCGKSPPYSNSKVHH